MENVKQKFLQSDHQGFLKDVEVPLIDKTQASDPTKRDFTGCKHLELCILIALILQVIISSLFRLIYTFTKIFGFASTFLTSYYRIFLVLFI